MQFDNLVDILEERRAMSSVGLTFIESDGRDEFMSYQRLHHTALQVLAYLQSRGLGPKDELIFQIEDNQPFIITFWACILGGIIPVPLKIGQTDDHRQKVFNVWQVLNRPRLITTRSILDKLDVFARAKGLQGVFSLILESSVDEGGMFSLSTLGRIVRPQSRDLAFIQFSSGSTGSPKGVLLTHQNLIANMQAISKAAGYTSEDSMISWMPLTHDMGLIGFHINPLFSGINQYLIPTGLFIRRPAIWLGKTSEHKVSILCSPNFGYEYLLRHGHIDDGHCWDLSPVRIIYNGAEPISTQLFSLFMRNLERFGLKYRSMYPVYGLAEASLAVTIPAPEDEITVIRAERGHLNTGRSVRETTREEDSVSFVSVGRPIDNCSLHIADDEDRTVEDMTIGHIQIRGMNVTAGYCNNQEETGKAFTKEGWLRTGDLGFMKAGSLYVTGRAKDILFINGQNYYPHDIERVAEGIEGIGLNKIAVAGFFNSSTGREEVIAFILYKGQLNIFADLARTVKVFVNEKTGLEIQRVLPVKEIPKTTSGKLQRFRLLEQMARGEFKEVESALDRLTDGRTTLPPLKNGPDGDLEQAIEAIWCRVLGLRSVSADQDFFEAGGNSLKAAELSMSFLKEFGIDIPVAKIYDLRTIRAQAGQFATLEHAAYQPIERAPKMKTYALPSAQNRIYYAWKLDTGSITYNNPVAFRLEGVLDVKSLESCILQLIRRYDLLRSSFHEGAAPYLVIRDEVHFSLDLAACGPDELDKRLALEVLPFDLSAPPLFRARLFQVKDGKPVLFFDFHHIIADGISIFLFIEELLKLYLGERLAPSILQFQDFICWEKEKHLRSGQAKAYWHDQLRDELPILDMPVDFPRPVIFDSKGKKMQFQTGIDAGELHRFAAANDCTLHVLLFSIYALLLSKYTGQEHLLIGIPISGRIHPDLQRMQGMLVNNLAIRTMIKGDDTFRVFLQEQKSTIAAALHHQDYPFGDLAEMQQRDMSRNALFDTMFIYQNMGVPAIRDSPIRLRRYFFDPGFSKYDLSLEIFEEEGALSYAIEYATALFNEESIVSLIEHFKNLTASILKDPDRVLSKLSLLKEGISGQNHLSGLPFQAGPVKGITIHELFEKQAEQTPGRIAIRYRDMEMTYRELDRRSGLVADHLRGQGVGRDIPVGIWMTRAPEMIIAILGVLKAGGCYLPVDADLPNERVRFLVIDCGCRLVITNEESGEKGIQGTGARILPIDSIEKMPEKTALNGCPATEKDLAYIIYTSGTTGKPKGVMIEHRSLVNYIYWAADAYIQKEPAVFPLFTSLSFDLTVTSIFCPLVTGNMLVIYGEEQKEMVLEKVIADNVSTIIKLTPSHLKIIAALAEKQELNKSGVRLFIVGGENLETELAWRIFQAYGGNVRICNEYGPTEATVGCMIHLFDPQSASRSVPIGIPAANTRIYILDKYRQPAPERVWGVLYIAGLGLARGYWNNEELTEEKFLPDPFFPGQKMYRSGDIARLLPEKIIEYRGRTDGQVKIRGYRIELSEIQCTLAAYHGIKEAVVTIRPAGTAGLYAYYTGIPAEEKDLRKFLAERLPHYMIPLHFIPMADIPLTRNGKIDPEGLPDAPAAGDKGYSPLYGDSERRILRIWKQILGQKNIGILDNFFELGGDSIKAIQIASRLSEMGISLQAKDILTYHTISQIAPCAIMSDTAPLYEQGIVTGRLNVTPIHEWFLGLNLFNPHQFNQSVRLRLRRKLDRGLLEKSFQKLIDYHDGLRLNYDALSGTLSYNLHGNFTLEEVPHAADDDRAGWDLSKSLLFQAVLRTEGDDSQFLDITAHHIIVDGISWRILLEDLYSIYTDLENGEEPVLPSKTGSLIDWEWELTSYLRNKDEEESAYWDEIDKTPFTIPFDLPAGRSKVSDMDTMSLIFPEKKIRDMVRNIYRIYQTDMSVLLNTALASVLHEWTGLDQLIIEQENHGRHLTSIDTSRTVGWFTALYPVKLIWKEGNWAERLTAIRDQLRQVPGHGIGYGARRCAPYLREQGKAARTLVRFNYLGEFGRELNNDLFEYIPAGAAIETDPMNELTAALEFIAFIYRGELHIDINYNTAAHTSQTINRLSELFLTSLDQIFHHLLEQQKEENNVPLTPQDFDLAHIDQEELDSLFE